MNKPTVISGIPQYQYVLHLSSTMLVFAQQKKWDELITLSSSYLDSLQQLMQESAITCTEETKEISTCLAILLKNEDEIKILLKSRMDVLSCEIGTIRQQQAKVKNYTNQLFSPYR